MMGKGAVLDRLPRGRMEDRVWGIHDLSKECTQGKYAGLRVKLERKEQASMWSQAKTDFHLMHGERALE